VALTENEREAGIAHWKRTLDSLVRDPHGTGFPSAEFRAVVVHFAGRNLNRAADLVRQTLVSTDHPDAVGADQNRGQPMIRDTFDDGIREWMSEQPDIMAAARGETGVYQEVPDPALEGGKFLQHGSPRDVDAPKQGGEPGAKARTTADRSANRDSPGIG
jgi:hypothetical protein